MTRQNQISTEQKEERSIARKNSYISYIEKYPLYSTLLVLEEYEGDELYEECAIIRDALTEYRDKYKEKFPKDMVFPTSVVMYKDNKHQDMMNRLNIIVKEEDAKEKAKLIKLNLPLDNGL